MFVSYVPSAAQNNALSGAFDPPTLPTHDLDHSEG
jgi:hypothetical protein